MLIRNKNLRYILQFTYKFKLTNLFLGSFFFIICFLYISWIKKGAITSFFFFNLDNLFLNVDNLKNNYFSGPLWNIFFTSLFLIIPFLSFAFIELIIRKGNTFNLFEKSSFYFLKNSGGYKYADIYYTIFGWINNLFPRLIIFVTFGSSIFSNKISNWFHMIYVDRIPLPKSTLSGFLIIIVAVLLTDLSRYINHYASHKIKFLWDFHEFHHSATKMSLLSQNRIIILDKVLFAPILAPLSVFNGLLIAEYLQSRQFLPIYIYLLSESILLINRVIAHSSFKLIYPKPISLFIMSPSLHWIHHSSSIKHFDSNFGELFTFWDLIFNTYLGEEHIEEHPSFGIKNSEYNKYNPFYCFYILPVLKLIKNVKKSRLHFLR